MPWLLTALLLAAEPSLTLEQAAQIELDQQKAAAAVARRYGDRKPSELTAQERGELIRAQATAEREVLDRHGVELKTWARFTATQDQEATAARQALVKDLAEKERKAEEAKAQAAPGEVPIQRGISDDQPAVLEESPDAPPLVEQGLPSEARADDEAAKDADSAAAATEQKKPEPRRRRRR